MSWFERKPIDAALAAAGSGGLRRTLGISQLTAFGVGSAVGAGIFVLTGTVAANDAGPAVTLSFIIASAVCLLAALCYAELAAALPIAGSAFAYTHVVFGELPAWVVGWCLMLEYMIAGSLIAIGWSGYAASIFGFESWVPAALLRSPFDIGADGGLVATGALVDLPAVLITLLCTALMACGTELSARVNSLIVLLKIGAILLVVAVGFAYVDTGNWTPFVPPNTGEFGEFGWSGVLRGAGLVFFAYIGFDAVSALGREARDPQRTMPVALLAALGICTLLYALAGLVLTGMVSYEALDVPDPFLAALAAAGPSLQWARWIVGFIAIVGLVSVLLASLIGQVRIFYAMAHERLLPRAFGSVHPRLHTPVVSSLLVGLASAAIAGFFPLRLLGELISIGTLLAFAFVCVGVIVARRRLPSIERPFRVPLVPWLPLAGAASCVYLMFSLPDDTWIRLAAWLALGLGIYGVMRGRRRAAASG